MNFSMLVPTVVLLVGGVVYYRGGSKSQELGRIAFFVGLLVLVLSLAQAHVRITGP